MRPLPRLHLGDNIVPEKLKDCWIDSKEFGLGAIEKACWTERHAFLCAANLDFAT